MATSAGLYVQVYKQLGLYLVADLQIAGLLMYQCGEYRTRELLKETKDMTLDRDKPQGVTHPVKEGPTRFITRIDLGRTNLLSLAARVTVLNSYNATCDFSFLLVSVNY